MFRIKFRTAIMLAAMLMMTETFASCDDEEKSTTLTPETPGNHDSRVDEFSQSIKSLAEAATDGTPIELTLDENTTEENLKDIASALAQNETVSVALDLSKAGFTSVPAEVFKDSKNLTEVVLPTAVTEIKNAAFKGCTSMKSLIFGKRHSKSASDTTITIGAWAFANCEELNYVSVPTDSVKIDPTAFENTRISMKSHHELLTFADTTNVQDVLILAHVTQIPDSLFYNEFTGNIHLRSLKFAEGSKLLRIGSSAFRECQSITSIELPESVVQIGDSAFFNSSSLSIEIPNNVEEIGSQALYDVNVIRFTPGQKLTVLENQTFKSTSSVFIIPASIVQLSNFTLIAVLQKAMFEEGSKCTKISGYNYFYTDTLVIPESVIDLDCSDTDQGDSWVLNGVMETVIFDEKCQIHTLGDSIFGPGTTVNKVYLPAAASEQQPNVWSNIANDSTGTLKEIHYRSLQNAAIVANDYGSEKFNTEHVTIKYYIPAKLKNDFLNAAECKGRTFYIEETEEEIHCGQ